MNTNDTGYRIYKIIGSGDSPVGGEDIGSKLRISRNAVNKHVIKLRGAGINILSGRKGYALIHDDVLNEYTLLYELEKAGIDISVYVLECVSTNTYSKTIGGEGEYLVAAPVQYGGKGRLTRKFQSLEGGAYLTYSYSPQGLSASSALNIVLMCGLAVSRCLDKYGVESEIKWPNDVLVGGKKICGILVESVLDGEYISRLYAGIGVNLYNDISELNGIATNLKSETDIRPTRAEFIARLTAELKKLLSEFESDGFNRIRAEYLSRSHTIGKRVTLIESGRKVFGLARGLSDYGYLILETDNGETREVVVGDVVNEKPLTEGK